MGNKSLLKSIALGAFAASFAITATGCSSGKDTIKLRILNMEDYIYINNPKDGYDEENIYDGQFKKYLKENYPEFKDKHIEVVYDTTDTNETLYSKLQTGKAYYDLICPSDYMIQKLMSQDQVIPLNKELVPNYFDESDGYASRYLLNICKNISTTTYKTKEVRSMIDYSVGYMWGTLGIIFNPEYSGYKSGANPISDFAHWSSLWNRNYNKTISIKNSMRDTYAVGIMETFKDELTALKQKHDNKELSDKEYNDQLSVIFNRCDEDSVKKVFKTLYGLKDNSFGLEVDSGKQDIITKKIGVNIAWSGDAVYSMDQAGDRFQVSKPFPLYYAIPDLGSNIWFDAWVMPKVERSEEQYKLAHAFLNFLCDPVYAAKNMDYTGYSSFIGGNDVRDLLLDCYDARTDCIYELEELKDRDAYWNVIYPDPNNHNVLTIADYSDCQKKSEQAEHPEFDNVPLYYYRGELDMNDEGQLIDSETREIVTTSSKKMVKLEKTYHERFEILDEWDVVDLSYIFEGTMEESSKDKCIFYCDGYFVEEDNTAVGGSFFAQYPTIETMTRCAVMKDYRENNTIVMKYWEEFKANSLPLWAIILFAVEGGLLLGGIVLLISKKQIKKSVRRKRNKETKC